jgi:dihydrofolate synthase / folylpolyglutamate synthase
LKLTGQPTAWDDPAAAAIGAIVGEYNRGVPRSDLASVRSLLRKLAPTRPRHHVVVVGTNGKTSTGTFLARLLAASGTCVGLYTSPHIARWSERVRIDGVAVDDGELISTLARVDRAAAEIRGASPDLRFFDLLTLAAEDIFGRAGVEIAVFEAGIGGRLDATRVLEPELAVLTSVGDDHRELLGTTPEQILREKLAIASSGATVVVGALGPKLIALASAWAAREGVRLVQVGDAAGADDELPRFQRRNLALAQRAAELAESMFSLPAPRQLAELGVWGRFERGELDGVSYLADVGHNPSAWEELLTELPRISPDRRWIAVVALTAERQPAELAAALAGAPAVARVLATVTPVRAARDPAEIVAALGREELWPSAEACETPAVAFERGLSVARGCDLDLLVTGSNYLVSEFLAWVADRTREQMSREGPPLAAARPEGTALGGTLSGADVLIESIRNDPVPVEFVAQIRESLVRTLGSGSSAEPAYSALEAAGQMWWMCIYLWLLSARSRESIDPLIAAVIPTATSLRASTPERRPVYVALLDPAGSLLQARLVRTRVEQPPVLGQRPRPFPGQADPRFPRL